jgi:hypothetical protein
MTRAPKHAAPGPRTLSAADVHALVDRLRVAIMNRRPPNPADVELAIEIITKLIADVPVGGAFTLDIGDAP